jgi:hypothetical protein
MKMHLPLQIMMIEVGHYREQISSQRQNQSGLHNEFDVAELTMSRDWQGRKRIRLHLDYVGKVHLILQVPLKDF